MSISATFSIDTALFRAALEAKRAAVIEANSRAAERIKDRGVELVQANTPVKSGNLQDSFAQDSYVETDAGGLDRAVIGSNVSYAPYVEYGTSKMAPRAMLRTGMSELSFEAQMIWLEELARAFAEG
jgi:HK97 gp10 family phage protein